jgi:hypothetical protein
MRSGATGPTRVACASVLLWVCALETVSSETPALARLDGTVTNAGGVPLAAAEIRVVEALDSRSASGGVPASDVRGRSDSRGHFELSVPQRLRRVIVVASASGYAMGHSKVLDLNTLHQGVPTIRLRASALIQGHVVDERGIGLAEAEVTAESQDPEDSGLPSSLRRWVTHTDARGAFGIDGAPIGQILLSARRDGFVSAGDRGRALVATTRSEPLLLRLYEAMYLSGVVVDARGVPIPGAQLAARAKSRTSSTVLVSDAGAFRVGPFPRGESVELIGSADGFTYSRKADIIAPNDRLRIVLTSNGALRGRIVDATTGKGIPEFDIVFHRRESVPIKTLPFPGTRHFKTVDGRFEWSDVQAGVWTVTARAHGYCDARLEGVLVGDKMARDLAVALSKGRTIPGRVRSTTNGMPVSGALVRAELTHRAAYHDPELGLADSVATDREGRFTLEGQPEALPVTLLVSAPGFASARYEIEPSDHSAIELVLSKGSALDGHVLNPDGSAAPKAWVRLVDLSSGTGGGLATDVGGRFTFGELSPGTYGLSAASDQGTTEFQTVIVSSDAPTEVELRIGAGRTVHGNVAGLLPGEHARVLLRGESATALSREADTDDSGAYSLRGVAHGRITLVAHTSSDREISKVIEVPADEEVSVDFEFPAGVRVSGTLTRGGRPVPFMTINARPLDGQATAASGESSQSGQYALEGLAPGSYRIETVDGSRQQTVHVTSNTSLDFQLPPLTLSGTVIDGESEMPVAGVVIVASAVESGPAPVKAETDFEGRFTLKNLDPRNYRLTVFKPSYEMRVSLQPLTESLTDVSIRLQPDEGVPIRVVDATSGQSLRTVFVTALIAGADARTLELQLDPQGSGQLPRALAGSSIRVWWFEYAPSDIGVWAGAPLNVALTAGR